MTLKATVAQAIDEIKHRFEGHNVTWVEDGDGGAKVTVHDLALGTLYNQESTWLAAHIVYSYPDADVYPHFVRQDLSRVDDRPLGDGTSMQTWEGQPAIQLSRRSNHLDPEIDRADLKFLKVIDWLRTHP